MEYVLRQEVELIGFKEVEHCELILLFERSIAPQSFNVPLIGRPFVSRFMQLLEGNYHRSDFSHIEAAALLSISHRQLHRKLKANTGMNFSMSLKKFRLLKAALLCYSGLQVTQIVDRVGFTSCSYFVKCFKGEFGVTPKQYQLQIS